MIEIINVHRLFEKHHFAEFLILVKERGLLSISSLDYYVDCLGLKKTIPRHKLSQKPFVMNEFPKIVVNYKKELLQHLPKRIMILKTASSQTFLYYQRIVTTMEGYIGDRGITTFGNRLTTIEWPLQDDGQYAYLKFICTMDDFLQKNIIFND